MADFAPNVTPRYVLKYRSVGRVHSIMMRGARGISFALMESYGQTLFNAFFTTMAAGLPVDLEFISASVAITDSDLFFPAAPPTAVTGAVALTSLSGQDSISHITFSGRGGLGSKVNLHVYGFAWGPDVLPAGDESDFVITAGESTVIANAIAALAADSHIRAIDNSQPVWRSQVTLKVNDYWLRKLRQGA